MQKNLRLEIIDLQNGSGNPSIERIYAEGNTDSEGSLRAQIIAGARSNLEKFSVPVVTRGVSPSLSGHVSGDLIADPFLKCVLNGASVTNNDWTGHPLAASFASYDLAPHSNKESIVLGNLRQGITHDYALLSSSGTGSAFIYEKRAALDFYRVHESDFLPYQTIKSGISDAWLTYDVRSGVNNKNIFAYSIEILDSISGVSGTLLQTPKYLASTLVGYSGYEISGADCQNVSLYLSNTGLLCQLSESQLIPEYEACLTGDLSPSRLQFEITRLLSGLTVKEQNAGTFEGTAIDSSAIISDDISLKYAIYKGIIKYNDPYSGDYISFKSYSFDYSGEYSGAYGVAPPYNQIEAKWKFGVDYSGIDSLVTSINTSLSGGSGKYLWLKGLCADQSLSGYFESGGLLKAYKLNDNEIAIESLRLGNAGKYQFSFYEASRPYVREDLNTLKYLRPNKISLQASNSYGNWIELDSYTGINWDSLTPKYVEGVLSQSLTGVSSGVPPYDPNPNETGVTGGPARISLAEYVISGYNKCGDYFEKPVHFYTLPSGFDCKQNDEDGDDSTTGSSQRPSIVTTGQSISYGILKTGWKFNNTNSFNYFRLVLDDFQSSDKSLGQGLQNEFLISNINFYGVESGTKLHTNEMCLLGASYTGQYMGYVTGQISGVVTGTADASGNLCLSKYRVSGVPQNPVKFDSHFGTATELFTGLVSACKTGASYYEELVEGHFYDSARQCLYFDTLTSGYITGSGYLSGQPVNIVTDEAWEQLKNLKTRVSGSGTGLFTGIIPDFGYFFDSIPVLGLLTGRVTGQVGTQDSGYYRVSTGISSSNLISGHSIGVTGTKEASAILYYNSPQEGDAVFINDVVILYSTGQANLAPTYYHNLSELKNIVNSGINLFGVSGNIVGGNIYLQAIDLGISGNYIPVTSTGSIGKSYFGAPNLTGGINYYYPVSPTGTFSGLLEKDFAATGLYTGFASGTITGKIKQLDFIRHFSDIWGLNSGDVDFKQNNWLTGNGSVYQNNGFLNLGLYTGHPDIIPLIVSYTNNPLVYSTDLARLTVTGYEMNSGLSMILSGQY